MTEVEFLGLGRRVWMMRLRGEDERRG